MELLVICRFFCFVHPMVILCGLFVHKCLPWPVQKVISRSFCRRWSTSLLRVLLRLLCFVLCFVVFFSAFFVLSFALTLRRVVVSQNLYHCLNRTSLQLTVRVGWYTQHWDLHMRNTLAHRPLRDMTWRRYTLRDCHAQHTSAMTLDYLSIARSPRLPINKRFTDDQGIASVGSRPITETKSHSL